MHVRASARHETGSTTREETQWIVAGRLVALHMRGRSPTRCRVGCCRGVCQDRVRRLTVGEYRRRCSPGRRCRSATIFFFRRHGSAPAVDDNWLRREPSNHRRPFLRWSLVPPAFVEVQKKNTLMRLDAMRRAII